jgi:hypothetical protein
MDCKLLSDLYKIWMRFFMVFGEQEVDWLDRYLCIIITTHPFLMVLNL